MTLTADEYDVLNMMSEEEYLLRVRGLLRQPALTPAHLAAMAEAVLAVSQSTHPEIVAPIDKAIAAEVQRERRHVAH